MLDQKIFPSDARASGHVSRECLRGPVTPLSDVILINVSFLSCLRRIRRGVFAAGFASNLGCSRCGADAGYVARPLRS